MAVTKMQKWTILVEGAYKEQLLEAMQEFQEFEPIEEEVTLTMSNALQHDEAIQKRLQVVNQQISRILLAEDILKPYANKKLKNQRFSLTMEEIKQHMVTVEERNILEDVLTVHKQLEDLNRKLASIQDKIQVLRRWKNLPLLPADIKQLCAVCTFVGTLPQTKTDDDYMAFKEQSNIVVEELFVDKLERGVVVFGDVKDKDIIEDKLAAMQFTNFHYPFNQLPNNEINDVVTEKKVALSERQVLIKQLEHLAESFTDLLFLEEVFVNERERLYAESLMINGHNVSAVTGWLAEFNEQRFKKLLQATLPESVFSCIKDTAEIDEKEVPTVLHNHPLIEPFELLTEMYSLPKYSEVDPTPLLAPFYAVFFGMMVADIGYGLLLLIGTWFALHKMSYSKSMRKNLRLFHILAYPSILWGIFFGSFFSMELPFRILSTSTDAISILGISVTFGVIQLIFGLLVNTHIQVQNKAYFTAFSDGLGWIGIFIGLIAIIVANVMNTELINQVGQWIIIVNVIGIVLSTAMGSQNKLAGLGSGLYKLYGASSYIGDLASYTRLMALCVAGASIGSSFNLIIGLLPPVAKFTVGIALFVVLQGLNLALALLGAYVHGIRLQFVEFFGKFYEGGGRKMKPLKTYEKYIDLRERHLEEK